MQTPRAYRRRSIAIALVALFVWAVLSFLLPVASAGSEVTLFGMPLHAALAVPVALPVLVLTMFWFAGRQNADDVGFGEDN